MKLSDKVNKLNLGPITYFHLLLWIFWDINKKIHTACLQIVTIQAINRVKISFCFKMATHCFKRRIARYLTSIIVRTKQSYLNFNLLMKLLCDISWHSKTTTIQHFIVWKLEILQLHRRQNAWHEDIQETPLFCSTAVFGLLH